MGFPRRLRSFLNTMTNRSLTLRLTAAALTSVALLSGCSTVKSVFDRKDTDKFEGVAVDSLYKQGHDNMIRGNWDRAEEIFKRLVAQYPYGPEAEQAQIETAYAQYKAGKNEDAITTIDRFLRTYPTHRSIAYMYYLRGLVNSNRDTVFLRRVWNLDASRRDLATPNQAFNDFSIVVNNYPNSPYAENARLRMSALRDLFARHELDVGLYYLRRDAFVSANSRARALLDTYPQSQFADDAIALLAASYKGLGNTALYDSAVAQLKQANPSHPYLTGRWPDYPSNLRKLNPFVGERSPIDSIAEAPPPGI